MTNGKITRGGEKDQHDMHVVDKEYRKGEVENMQH